MVGCSVPYCTNRSDKGFKTFRIPYDPRRREQWIRFSGRSNWNPGAGASYCQAHFDESAFESHRADGLRKLKPNAVPTIHTIPANRKKPRKQNVEARVDFPSDDSSSDIIFLEKALSRKSDEEESIQIDEVFLSETENKSIETSGRKNVKRSYTKETDSKKDKIKRLTNEESRVLWKFGDTEDSVKCSKDEEKCSPATKRKRGRPPKKRKEEENVRSHGNGDSTMDVPVECNGISEKEVHSKTNPPAAEECAVECFVCNKLVSSGYSVSLNTPTEVTHVVLFKRLEAITDSEGTVDPQEVVCSRCASLLNHIDRTEAELNMLKGAISVCARRKNKHDRNSKSDPEFIRNVQLLDQFERLQGDRHNKLTLDELIFMQCERDNAVKFEFENDCVAEEQTLETTPLDNIIADAVEEVDESNEEREIVENDEEETVSNVSEVGASNCGESSKETDLKVGEKLEGEKPNAVKVSNQSRDNSFKGSSTCAAGESNADIPKSEVHGCKICPFKTSSKSVMIWHLRMHMKNTKWCDFCCTNLPENFNIVSHFKRSRAPNKVLEKKVKPEVLKKFILPKPNDSSGPSARPDAYVVDPSTSPAYPVALIPFENSGKRTPIIVIAEESTSITPDGEGVSLNNQTKHINILNDSIVSNEVGSEETTCILNSSALYNKVITTRGQVEKSTFDSVPMLTPLNVELLTGRAKPQITMEGTITMVEDSFQDPGSTVVINEESSASVSGCDGFVGHAVVQHLNSLTEQSDVAVNECVDVGAVFIDEGSEGMKVDNACGRATFCEDRGESNFMVSLSSRSDRKFSGILSEMCDEQTVLTIATDASESNITNKDVNFARSECLGENELTIAYENSVAALMCNSDDSNGILPYS